MDVLLRIQIFEENAKVDSVDLSGPLELGRQRSEDPEPYELCSGVEGFRRLVIARLAEDSISRRQLTFQPLPGGRVSIANVGNMAVSIVGPGGQTRLTKGEERSFETPSDITLGSRRFRIEKAAEADEGMDCFPEETLAPGSLSTEMKAPNKPLLPFADTRVDALIPSLRSAVNALQAAANSADFKRAAAKALVEIVSLESGRVLLWRDGDWQTDESHSIRESTRVKVSKKVLERVRRDKKPFWIAGPNLGTTDSKLTIMPQRDASFSTEGLETVVAAPILSRTGEVVGALYGERGGTASMTMINRPIGKLEVMLVEILATGVAAGLAREEADKHRVQFEQFFTPELAHRLLSDPTILEGQDATITALFVDIHGFSRISERVGTSKALPWIRRVMTELSRCVIAEKGVLVDFVGDAVFAMWGAPDRQPDHALRAVRAGLEMMKAVEALNDEFTSDLPGRFSLSVGLNTGMARVGNVGSNQKFKYGPLGATVNMASRVQGATKFLKCRTLITHQTRELLDDSVFCRRVVRTQVVGMDEAVDLYEVRSDAPAEWRAFCEKFERALVALESRDFRGALTLAAELMQLQPKDGPLVLLLSRATDAITRDGEGFEPVWILPGK